MLAVLVTSPLLTFVGRYRASLPRVQRLMDRLGVQVRSTHYYEPTYADADLPAETQRERPLPGLDLNGDAQLALLSQFCFEDELRAIPLESSRPDRFGYRNTMYSFGDAEILYSMIRLKQPRRIVEVGSGTRP